jgi:murein DD-endopeptidase MepM/ murein hydrolase activator NlpD
VVYADTYAGYGNMFEIDHGNELICRACFESVGHRPVRRWLFVYFTS